MIIWHYHITGYGGPAAKASPSIVSLHSSSIELTKRVPYLIFEDPKKRRRIAYVMTMEGAQKLNIVDETR